MGNNSSKKKSQSRDIETVQTNEDPFELSEEDLEFCREFSDSNHIDLEKAKELVNQWNRAFQKTKAISPSSTSRTELEINNSGELLLMLTQLGFWEKSITQAYQVFQDSAPVADGPNMNARMIEFLIRSPEYQELVARMYFDAFDSNRDGMVSRKELISGLLAINSSGREKAVITKTDEATVLFDAWDMDSNGYLSRDEVKKMIIDTQKLNWVSHDLLTAFSMAVQMRVAFENVNKTPLNVQCLRQVKVVLWISDIIIPLLREASDKMLQALENNSDNLERAIDETFNVFDENADGVIGRDEFVEYRTNKQKGLLLAQKLECCYNQKEIQKELQQKINANSTGFFQKFQTKWGTSKLA